MNILRKRARDWLKQSSRRSFHEVIDEAKLTPRQMEIIKMRFLDDLSVVQIAMKLNLSEETIKVTIQNAYDQINRILDC